MHFSRLRRSITTTLCSALLIFFVLLCFPAAHAQEKMHLHVDDYQIDAQLDPHNHHIAAKVKVKFTALELMNIASFELHNDLRVTKVTDDSGKVLPAERIEQENLVRVTLPAPRLTRELRTSRSCRPQTAPTSSLTSKTQVEFLTLAMFGFCSQEQPRTLRSVARRRRPRNMVPRGAN